MKPPRLAAPGRIAVALALLVACSGEPATPEDRVRATLAAKAQEELERDGVAEVDLGGVRPVRVGRELFDDLAEDHLSAALAGSREATALEPGPLVSCWTMLRPVSGSLNAWIADGSDDAVSSGPSPATAE